MALNHVRDQLGKTVMAKVVIAKSLGRSTETWSYIYLECDDGSGI